MDKNTQNMPSDSGEGTASTDQVEPVVNLPSLTLPEPETTPITVTKGLGAPKYPKQIGVKSS